MNFGYILKWREYISKSSFTNT